MKAVVYTAYGPPDVLQLREVDKPVPKANEVLIRVHSTTVNRTDCGFRQPEYVIVRVVGGLFKPRRHILGNELAGEIEAVGTNVTTFAPGDQVFGISGTAFGAHAEYCCVREDAAIALKPVNMSYTEAAAVCDGMMLGLNMVRAVDVSRAPSILVNGASGSIGSACVQLATYYGAHITAVCRARDFALLQSLGAERTIDYTREDFTESDARYDVVLDAVGKSSFFRCRRILKPRGVYLSTELGPWWQNIVLALITPLLGGKKVKFPIPTPRKRDIVFFKKLIEEGHYRAVIDRIYPLDDIVEATRYVETGEKTGNVVITVG